MHRLTCKSCAYFEVVMRIVDGKEFGQCHRHAPRSARHFPEVAPSDWCGEHSGWDRYNRYRKLLATQEAAPCPTSGSSADLGTTESKTSS